ncbi:uncharacterized protein LOC108629391 [Ceratina calcarata]|uniref:Uncharacterized protein LOC108629391 n=1 Tax=Ceratina calcarata TaxID=156304 RepID=A0AAJ7WED5_9HYME|nr:uncharacterized protein LOC108629391 [Ceratina calcarata]
MEEQEARDMRALKAYNEVTLWKDKKELEKDKKRWPWKRYPGESGPESSRSRPQTNKKNDRPKKDTSRITEASDDRPDKENLLVDAATETEGLASTRDTKLPTVKMSSFASEKYTCPRLAKLNKVTDKLLSNFDRLQGGQMKQDSRRSKPASETDTRKPHTKYSRPKKADEENVSVASIKKVEGAQKGRELERTPAREDVRDPATISVSSSTTEESLQLDSRQRCTNIADTFARINYDKVSSTYMDGMNLVERNDDLLMFKSTIIQEVTSSCSSSTIGQADELLLPVQDLNALDEDETQMLVGHSRIPVRILDMEDRKTEVYTIAEDYNEMYAQQTQIETRNKEIYTIPGMEDRQTEVEDMSKHEIGTVTEIKKDKKEETERPEVADASTVLVQEQIENLEKTDTIEKDIEIEELQEKLESQAKQISEDNSSNNELIEVEESKVSGLEEPTEGQEFEIGGSRSDSLEVSENRSERILRRPSRNMSDFVRNINMNYVANGVILSNSNAPRTNIPPQWDIVEDETVRTLQNALSYGSRDNPFDLMGEIVTMDDVLNLRSSESSADDFIFETSRESSNPSGVDFSREENTFRQTILATIRHLQNLEETDHDEAPCNLFITTIQRESLPIDLGMETVDHFEFEDEEDNEHPTINEFGDLLTQVFRALNIRGLHPSNISGLRFEILRNSFTEDEEEEDEGDDEESRKEERASMEERLLRFIKEDIFTDIKFPIVVKMSDLIPGVIPPVKEEAEEIIGLRQMEASKINLFSLADDKSEDGEDYLDDMIRNRYANGHLQDLEEDEESMFTAHSSRQFTSISDYNLVESAIRDDRLASSYLDQPSTSSSVSPGLAGNYKKYTMIRSEPLQVRKGATRDMLNRTYDLFPTPFKEEEGSTSSEEIEKEIEIDNLQEFKDGSKQLYKHSEVEESVNTEIERSFVKTVDESIQLTKFENEKTVEASRNEDTFRTNGNDSLSKEEEVKEARDIGTEDETSLKIIFIFWVCVIIFYLKYFYKKVTSYKHNSTSTSTLKPFEIHTVPTSTSSLFEHVRYLGMQEEEIENDSLERIVDLEETDTSRSSDCNQLPDFDSSNCFRATYETSFKHVENKDDEVIWSDCVSENIQNPSGANALREQNRDSLDTELRREEQIDSGILRPNIITNDVSLSVDDKIGKTDTTRFEEQRLIELRLAEKEIEAFRYKEDDDSSSSKSSPRREDEMKLFDDTKSSPCAELHIEEEKERPEAKEFDNSKKLNSSFLIEEKKCNELKEEESANDQTGNREETNLETRSVKEVAGADEPQSPPEVLRTYLPTTDSFDSTYTKESETSKNATSTVDLNESSMEDFPIRSNESILES